MLEMTGLSGFLHNSYTVNAAVAKPPPGGMYLVTGDNQSHCCSSYQKGISRRRDVSALPSLKRSTWCFLTFLNLDNRPNLSPRSANSRKFARNGYRDGPFEISFPSSPRL